MKHKLSIRLVHIELEGDDIAQATKVIADTLFSTGLFTGGPVTAPRGVPQVESGIAPRDASGAAATRRRRATPPAPSSSGAGPE